MTTMTSEDVTEVRRAKRSWPAQCKLDILTEIETAKDSDATSVAEICRREGRQFQDWPWPCRGGRTRVVHGALRGQGGVSRCRSSGSTARA